MKLTQLLNADNRQQTRILAISIDSHEDSQALINKLAGADFQPDDLAFLEDKNHKVINRYGILNEQGGWGIPHPATYVIDKQGVVRWRFVQTNYRKRADNEEIVKALRALQQ